MYGEFLKKLKDIFIIGSIQVHFQIHLLWPNKQFPIAFDTVYRFNKPFPAGSM